MATKIYKNAYLSVAGNNLSAYIKQLAVTQDSENPDDTTMGDSTRSVKEGGLLTWSIAGELVQDFAASNLDSILAPLHNTTVAIEFRPDAGSVSTSNPKRTANALFKYNQIVAGEVGALAMASITLTPSKGSGSATLTRGTT